ncbi:MAG: amino acid ABC transporter permease [Actinomycetota bacterium]|nr:amino acid ABC transporter permease [Actinomycetota bacterium]
MDLYYFFDPSNWEWVTAGKNFTFLLEGFLVNIEIALVAMALSLILGLFLALARISRNRPLSAATGVWIDIWRNLPLVFILLYFFLALPSELKNAYQDNAPGWLPEVFQEPQILAAIFGLTVYNSAVIAEIMRAGIISLERGQGEAAYALGLSYWKSMRLVILPQGLRRMVPATVSQLITLTKDTSLVSILAISELVRHGRIVTNTSDNPFVGLGVPAPILHVFILVGAMFVLFNLLLSRLSRRLEIKERQRTGTKITRVTGLEDQVAAEADVT